MIVAAFMLVACTTPQHIEHKPPDIQLSNVAIGSIAEATPDSDLVLVNVDILHNEAIGNSGIVTAWPSDTAVNATLREYLAEFPRLQQTYWSSGWVDTSAFTSVRVEASVKCGDCQVTHRGPGTSTTVMGSTVTSLSGVPMTLTQGTLVIELTVTVKKFGRGVTAIAHGYVAKGDLSTQGIDYKVVRR